MAHRFPLTAWSLFPSAIFPGSHAPRLSTRSRTRNLTSVAAKAYLLVQELCHRSRHLVDLY
ncbi:hypothetical protein chiPu_0033199, partial [Chiloscyllium punctatum]|nr:hypothetical protein [Chiloscyllium punctatum]